MLDITALFKLSYGIYLITAHDGDKNAGCLVNTVFQITAEPVRVGVSVSKENQTHCYIRAGGTIAVNVVDEKAASPLLGKFGYRTGRDIDKFAETKCHKDIHGDMYIDEGVVSQFSCKVVKEVDMDTHTIFICDVVDSNIVCDGAPMTYNYYREVKKLQSSKFAPTYVNLAKH
ncbi:flavin reductase family protein [Hydrogenoanaerobacterium sp.]|uniref:flavin reductase family protein n=1 Tax=Hydrogenoanaerobacterium sp. TaxID=2953763 RepID=UPI00289DC3F1|nr:flavin reductase family protein [Hydrogenoanaerobacterium sp.]